MLKVDLNNFRNLRRLSLHDDAKVQLVLGYNEEGKSSLIGAIQYAISGTAFGLRGDATSALVTHGEERMQVRVQVGDRMFNRTRTGGDPLKGNAERFGVASDVLPLLFNQKLVGDGGNKHMKAFLATTATERFDPRAAFQNDPDMASTIKQANQAGHLSTKQVIAYCERMRASNQPPPSPVAPSAPYPQDAEIENLRAQEQKAQASVSATAAALDELEGYVASIGRIGTYYPARVAWEQLKERANRGDALGDQRQALTRVASLAPAQFQAAADILKAAGFTELSQTLTSAATEMGSAVAAAKTKLLEFPPPPTLPPAPTLSTADQQFATDAGLTEATLPAFSATLMKELGEKRLALTAAKANHAAAQRMVGEAQQNLGAWKAYEQALPRHEDAVLRSQAEWKRWDNAAKAIEAAERDFAQQAGNVFADLVTNLGGFILQNRKITVDIEKGLRLGDDPIELLSESTGWRTEVAVMAAIAATAKSPLLLIDGADILDIRNRTLFLQFLLERISPHFEHVIVTSTVRARLEDENPSPVPGVTKWVLNQGTLTQLISKDSH